MSRNWVIGEQKKRKEDTSYIDILPVEISMRVMDHKGNLITFSRKVGQQGISHNLLNHLVRDIEKNYNLPVNKLEHDDWG